MCTRHVLHVLFVALLSRSVGVGAEPEGRCPAAFCLGIWGFALGILHALCNKCATSHVRKSVDVDCATTALRLNEYSGAGALARARIPVNLLFSGDNWLSARKLGSPFVAKQKPCLCSCLGAAPPPRRSPCT